MSRTLSISCGSGDSLKISLRWGRRPKSVPDATDGLATQPRRAGKRARAPMGGARRSRLQRGDDYLFHLFFGDGARPPVVAHPTTRRHGPVRSVRAPCRRSPATTAGGGPPSCCYDRRRRRGPHVPAVQLAGTCESAEPASPDAPVRRPSELWQPLGVLCARSPPRKGSRPGSPHILYFLRERDTSVPSRRHAT